MTSPAIPEPRDRRPQVLTPAECHKLLVKAARYDGRTPGAENVEDWHEAAVKQRWTNFEVCLAAIVDYYTRAAKPGERIWIMPGHITEYVRAEARQPAPVSERWLEIEAAAPAADEARAKAVREYAEAIARMKSIPGRDRAPGPDPEVEAKLRAAARDELRRQRWEKIDACDLCDDEGLYGAGIVCVHRGD